MSKYVIKNLEDFFQIPEEKLSECLTDFFYWILVGKQIKDDSGLNKIVSLDGFKWIDDGIQGISSIEISKVKK